MYEGLKNLDVPTKRGAAGGGKHPRARRFAKVGLSGFIVLVVLIVAVGGFTYWRVKTNVENAIDVELGFLADAAPGEPMNILIIGSDSRKGITKEDRKKGLGGPGGRRSDVIMLLHMGGQGRKSVLVSFPRDLRVEIPKHGSDKINAAYAYGGRKLVVRTVERFSGLTINHVLEVNFLGFREIVETVGGVPVRTSRALQDDKAKLHIPKPGCWILDGDEALAFVRARNPYPDADIGRISAQHTFLRALAAKVGSIPVLLNPATLTSLSGHIGEYFVIDPDLLGDATFDRARAIAAKLATTDENKLDFRVVPHSFQTINGISYVIANEGETQRLFAALAADKNPPDVGLTSQSVPDRDDVTVQVLNGTNKAGLASDLATKLRKKEFQVLSPGNAPRRLRTLILYNQSDELKAKLVRRFVVAGARMQKTDKDLAADVVVVIGRNYVNPNVAPSDNPEAAKEEPCLELKS